MTPEIEKIVVQIQVLQKELEERFRKAQEELYGSLEGGRLRFSNEIRKLHKQYRVNVLRYILQAKPLTLLTAPVVYVMIVPLLLLDISLTLYQHICFRAYGIPRVRRRDFFVVDRHKLAYLNIIEKINCAYCGYANGLIAYVQEIISCTEQYWCPIRHARHALHVHKRYAGFFAYGDAEAYRNTLDNKRIELEGTSTSQNNQDSNKTGEQQ